MPTLYTRLQIYKEILLLTSITCLIFTILPRSKAYTASIDTVDMFGLSHIRKKLSSLNFL